MPPGLAKLSPSLKALADFLCVEDELIEVAAQGIDGEAPSEPSAEELVPWIKKLPAADKNQYLLRFLTDEGDLLLRSELFQRYKATIKSKNPHADQLQRRKASRLLAACDARIEEKRRKKAKPARKR